MPEHRTVERLHVLQLNVCARAVNWSSHGYYRDIVHSHGDLSCQLYDSCGTPERNVCKTGQRRKQYETLPPGPPRLDLISRHEQKKEKERPSMPAHFPTFPQVPLLRVVYLKLAHPTPWVSFSHSFQLALVAGTPVTPTLSSLHREAGLTHMRVQRFCSTINTSRITSLRTSHPTRWCSRGDAIRRANISFRRSR